MFELNNFVVSHDSRFGFQKFQIFKNVSSIRTERLCAVVDVAHPTGDMILWLVGVRHAFIYIANGWLGVNGCGRLQIAASARICVEIERFIHWTLCTALHVRQWARDRVVCTWNRHRH